jgi:hypothetical protein
VRRISGRGTGGVALQAHSVRCDSRGYPTTPAMAAGIERRVWTHRDIAHYWTEPAKSSV